MKANVEAVAPQYFTKTQAQLYTALSERTLDYARERGELPFYRYGKRVLLKKGDLDVWMERHRACVVLDKIVDEVMAEGRSDGRSK